MKDYETEINNEIVKRLSEMESAEYQFPKRFGLKDYILVAAVVVTGIIGIIVGAYL